MIKTLIKKETSMTNPYAAYGEFTRLYRSIQGLYTLPIGIGILFSACQRLGIRGFGDTGDLGIALGMIAFTGIVWFFTRRYYDRAFGKVEPVPYTLRQELSIFGTIAGFVVTIVIEALLSRSNVFLPVSLLELVIGIAYVYTGKTTSRGYYTITGAGSILFAFTPLLTGAGLRDSLWGSFGIAFTLYLGGMIVITSLLDHFRLVRGFRQLSGGAHFVKDGPR
jgi:hypothetical protein